MVDKELKKFVELVWCAALDISTSDDFKDVLGNLDEEAYEQARQGVQEHAIKAIKDYVERLCIEARQDEIEKIMDYKGWVSENVFNAVRNQLDDRLEELESLKELDGGKEV